MAPRGEQAGARKYSRYVLPMLTLAAAFAALFILDLFPWFSRMDWAAYDYSLKIRPRRVPAPEIAIVAIDESSLAELGPYPWDRRVHALLLRKLRESGARMAVFDVLFDQPTESEKDAALAQAIAEFGPVVLAQDSSKTSDPLFQLEVTLEPLEIFRKAGGRSGFVAIPVDEDNRIRRAVWLMNDQPSLATAALSLLSGQPAKEDAGGLFVGGSRMPVDAQGRPPTFLINYAGPSHTLPTRSYYQVLDGTIPAGFLNGKIVFIGADLAAENKAGGPAVDRFSTPVDEDTLMPGVEIHANALNTIMTRSFIRVAPAQLLWLALLVAAALSTLYCLALRPLGSALATAATATAVSAGAYYLFANHHFWFPPIRPLFVLASVYGGHTLIQFRSALRERAQIRNAFKHYVSAEVLGELMKNPDRLELGGREVEATVLFSDIAGFSKISEKIVPQELTRMLNQYFELLATVIMKENGMVNKFIGDAVMALWGVPLDNPRHAIDACRAALQMQQAMRVMQPLRCRVGLNTGKMIAGNLGSRQRFEYTVVGDAVNLASRLEGVNKPYHTDILISEMTEEKIRDHFLLREVDSIRVIGKEMPVKIFEVLDHEDNQTTPEYQQRGRLIESFACGLESYHRRQWKAAADLFEQHLRRFPGDPVGRIYIDRCLLFNSHPPAEDWDGVYQMESK